MKKIKNILLPIKKWELLYSCLFSLMCMFGMHIVNEDVDRSTVLTTYITAFVPTDVILLVLVAIVCYVCVQLLKKFFGSWHSVLVGEQVIKKPAIWIVCIVIINIILWIPYFMSHWPGGIYNDTLYSIHIALGEQPFDNQNTVFYALFWRLIFWIGGIVDQGAYGGLKLMTLLQAFAMIVTAASFFVWLGTRGVRRWVVVTLSALFALMPVFPYYAISLWKDTWFGLYMFWYSLLLFTMTEGIRSGRKLTSVKNITLYVILSLLICFGRNNGIYIVIFTSLILGIIYIKIAARKEVIGILAVSIAIIIGTLIIQGPVYKASGVIPSNTSEKFGIPLQQIGYTISAGGKMSESEREIIEQMLPIEGWINLYNPTVADSIKFDPLFKGEYLDNHSMEFVKAYFGIMLKNPALCLKSYLISTLGFWDIWESSSSAYICSSHCFNAEFFMSDYFNQYTGLTLSDIVGPRWYISSGLLIWIMLFAVCAAFQKKKYDGFVILAPSFALWITLMIASPISFSFRYTFPMLLCIPIYVMSVSESKESKTLDKE